MNSAVFKHVKAVNPHLFPFMQERQLKINWLKRKEVEMKAKSDLWEKLLLMVVKKKFPQSNLVSY